MLDNQLRDLFRWLPFLSKTENSVGLDYTVTVVRTGKAVIIEGALQLNGGDGYYGANFRVKNVEEARRAADGMSSVVLKLRQLATEMDQAAADQRKI